MNDQPTAVRHRLIPIDPAGHLFEVETLIQGPDPVQVLSLPVWIPGSYLVREFPRNIVSISASSGVLVKRDKSTWEVHGADDELTLTYRVYAWDLSVRTAHLDQNHGFFNGTSTFLAVHGREHGPQQVVLAPPSDPDCATWRVATTLPAKSLDHRGFGEYEAADYDELVDHPVEMGSWVSVHFDVDGVVHEIVLTGRLPHNVDLQRLCDDLVPVVRSQVAMFGDGLPFERYVFMLTVVGSGYGGLEHRSSTALIASRADLPTTAMQAPTDGYLRLLGLFSHEYFHLWNVKRIKPAAFVPYDLSREGHTTLLWAFEGITSYYDDLSLLRAGTVDAEGWMAIWGKQASRVYQTPGRFTQSLADSSFDAWTKFYRQDENAVNALISYYTKGAMVAIALDLLLRERSEGRVTLDDVMRTLWFRYGKPGVGVPEDGIEVVCAELLGDSLQDFFDLAVRGTDDLPLPALLEGHGMLMHLRPRQGQSDTGGAPVTDPPATATFGARCVRKGDGWRLAAVTLGGPAHRAGLAAGDIVVAVDGLKTTKNPANAVVLRSPGTALSVHAFRSDELMEVRVVLTAPVADTVWLELDPNASEQALARRLAWLGV